MKIGKFIWVLVALLSLGIPKVLPSSVIEQYYSRGLFLLIRQLIDFFTNLLPFPLVYVLLLALFFYIIGRAKNRRVNKQGLLHMLGVIINFIAVAVFFFQVLWGVNYARIPIDEYLNLKTSVLNNDDLIDEFTQATSSLLDSHKKYNQEKNIDNNYTETELRESLTTILKELNYPTSGKVRGRIVNPKGILLRVNASGIYIPYTGEGHIDNGLHELKKPFTMTHEMAHGYGFADEGACNFLAYLATFDSTNSFVNYSSRLAYWRYVARDMIRNGLLTKDDVYAYLPLAIRNDLEEMRKQSEKYPDLFPKFGDSVYDSYLKAQGVKEGRESYNKIITLVRAHRTSAKYIQ